MKISTIFNDCVKYGSAFVLLIDMSKITKVFFNSTLDYTGNVIMKIQIDTLKES